MTIEHFFNSQSPQSNIKAKIVAKYFYVWATIIVHHARARNIAFVDLFAGQGRYEDGSDSTPILVLETAINNVPIAKSASFWFNDHNANFIATLEETAQTLPGIDKLNKLPEFSTVKVDDQLVEKLKQRANIPTLLFIDPWGYKSLSLDLINSVLQHPKSEVIFFFNYLRINAAITNRYFEQHIYNLFGQITANELRNRIRTEDLNSYAREVAVVDAVTSALQSDYAKFVQSFRFLNDAGTRCTHHLIFATKHPLGLAKMKDIMAPFSTGTIDGVPDYEYNPAALRQHPLELADPIADLGVLLLRLFSGQTKTVKQIYEDHQAQGGYLKKNYRTALLRLESEGRIQANPNKGTRRKNTMGDNVQITFPG